MSASLPIESLAGSFSFSGPASGTAVSSPVAAMIENVQKIKASIRAKVEHPFRVVKHQFGHTKLRYCGLARNTAQLHTPCSWPICGWCGAS